MEKEKIFLTLTQERSRGGGGENFPSSEFPGPAAPVLQLQKLHSCLLLKENTHPSFSEPANPCFSESEHAKVLTRVTFIQLWYIGLSRTHHKRFKGWNKDKVPLPLYIFHLPSMHMHVPPFLFHFIIMSIDHIHPTHSLMLLLHVLDAVASLAPILLPP